MTTVSRIYGRFRRGAFLFRLYISLARHSNWRECRVGLPMPCPRRQPHVLAPRVVRSRPTRDVHTTLFQPCSPTHPASRSHGRNTIYSEGAQPNLSAHRAVRAVDVLRPRSSLLFPAPSLPHVAPRPSRCTCSHTFIHLSAHPPRVQRTIPRPIARALNTAAPSAAPSAALRAALTRKRMARRAYRR